MTGASVCDNQHCKIKCLLNCKMRKPFYNTWPYFVCVILIEQRIHMVIFSVSISIRNCFNNSLINEFINDKYWFLVSYIFFPKIKKVRMFVIITRIIH